MIKTIKYRYFVATLHALVWSTVLFFPYFISNAENDYKIGPHPGYYFTLSGIIHMIIFYANTLFLYPRLLNRKYWYLYIVSAVLLIFFSVRLKFYLLATFFPNDLENVRPHVLFPSVLVFIVSVFYSILFEKIRAEKMQLGMELKLLRSQISPHFLFNILTSMVSLARKKSDQLEPSLLMLSGLMRYMLNDTGKKISLQQEVEYLESYVSLQKLRFGREVKIGFKIEVPQQETGRGIEPMLLVPFVENAFKHGTGYPEQPFIDICLKVKDGILDFEVKNKFDPEAEADKDDGSGIGLNNVRSRLTLLYPGRHDLRIYKEAQLFSIHLTLKLL